MKKLEISFSDTDEKAILDEDSLIIAIDNKTTADDLTKLSLIHISEPTRPY